MDLITDHVLQSLVKSGAEENHDFQSLSGETIVHDFVSVLLIA
jgi:hypothetical protein